MYILKILYRCTKPVEYKPFTFENELCTTAALLHVYMLNRLILLYFLMGFRSRFLWFFFPSTGIGFTPRVSVEPINYENPLEKVCG